MAREIVHIPAKPRVVGTKATAQKKIRVAAYCRVSSEQDEQLNSFENQVNYYEEYISNHPDYELAGIYADEGISGTSTKRREEFNRMIADCEAGLIDMVITKSISRFARNTQDCLMYSRRLKDLGIGIRFEKENINTMDSTGELLLRFCPPLRRMRVEAFLRTASGAFDRFLREASIISTRIVFTAMIPMKMAN